MQWSPRRAALPLIAAAAIILSEPSLGYAQQASQPGPQSAGASGQPGPSSDLTRYGPAPGAPDTEGHTVLSPYDAAGSPEGETVEAYDDMEAAEQAGLNAE